MSRSMRSFAVFEPAAAPRTLAEAADKTVFVPQKFSWPAFFFGPLWFLAKGLWLPLIGYLVVAGAIGGLLALVPNTRQVAGLIWLLFAVLVALEASELRRLALEWRGWRQVATVSALSLFEAEARYFDGRLRAARPAPQPARPASPPPAPPLPAPLPAAPQRPVAGTESGIVGLFPNPEPGAGR